MPKPLSELPTQNIKAVFSDFDGTLTEGQSFRSSTLAAIENLKKKEIAFVIVSGRPAGWADCLMRILPADAMIFENGAGILLRRKENLVLETLAPPTAKKRLKQVFEKIKKKHPSVKLASDQAYRLYDYAIDFGEEAPKLGQKEIDSILKALKKEDGITAKLSSIHINYWEGKYSKLEACKLLLKKMNLKEEEVVFVGDSPNDGPAFEFFTRSVGVSNVRPYLDSMKEAPKFITTDPQSAGFRHLTTIF